MKDQSLKPFGNLISLYLTICHLLSNYPYSCIFGQDSVKSSNHNGSILIITFHIKTVSIKIKYLRYRVFLFRILYYTPDKRFKTMMGGLVERSLFLTILGLAQGNWTLLLYLFRIKHKTLNVPNLLYEIIGSVI